MLPLEGSCARAPDRGCVASPMQVVSQETEQDSLLLVSFLPNPLALPCDSNGFGRLSLIESCCSIRDFLSAFVGGFCSVLVDFKLGSIRASLC